MARAVPEVVRVGPVQSTCRSGSTQGWGGLESGWLCPQRSTGPCGEGRSTGQPRAGWTRTQEDGEREQMSQSDTSFRCLSTFLNKLYHL